MITEVVGDGDDAAIVRDGEVAGVDAGADLCDDLQRVQVVLGDPAVARSEVDESAVGRELGAAMQGEMRRKPRNRLETVAVEDGDVVVTALDDDEEVQGIGALFSISFSKLSNFISFIIDHHIFY